MCSFLLYYFYQNCAVLKWLVILTKYLVKNVEKCNFCVYIGENMCYNTESVT